MDPHTIETTSVILYNNIIRVLGDAKATASELEEALKPFAVIQWARRVIEHITVAKLNRLFGRLKRSSAPKETLRIVVGHFRRALVADEMEIPIQFAIWRELTHRFALTTLATPRHLD